MTIRILILVGLVAGAMAFAVSLQGGQPARAAAGPCGTSQGDLSGPEAELLGLLNSWRSSTLGQPAMSASAPANWAAQIHAEAIASGSASGHTDSLGRSWSARLIDCGYP
ncbi:MAG: hypothetical protein KJ048_12610, partial [Dehalococcoidia bacterium]|nr:hypothetical protein [Dehalococcoidia bacterium]